LVLLILGDMMEDVSSKAKPRQGSRLSDFLSSARSQHKPQGPARPTLLSRSPTCQPWGILGFEGVAHRYQIKPRQRMLRFEGHPNPATSSSWELTVFTAGSARGTGKRTDRTLTSTNSSGTASNASWSLQKRSPRRSHSEGQHAPADRVKKWR
jgi:hypothetical protein